MVLETIAQQHTFGSLTNLHAGSKTEFVIRLSLSLERATKAGRLSSIPDRVMRKN